MRATSLAAIPDGAAKEAGIAVGETAALAVLVKRANDGSSDDTPYTPGTEPGQYRPTPPDFTPAFRPGLGQVAPFAIKSGAQFRIAPPPALDSRRYTRDYNEVKQVAEVYSSERPPDRADVARFYAVTDAVPLYFPAARQVSQAQGKTLAENARIFALLSIVIFDAAVAVFDSKYFYNYWRPVAAIHGGDRDGNRRTDADANWAAFVPTSPFPSSIRARRLRRRGAARARMHVRRRRARDRADQPAGAGRGAALHKLEADHRRGRRRAHLRRRALPLRPGGGGASVRMCCGTGCARCIGRSVRAAPRHTAPASGSDDQ